MTSSPQQPLIKDLTGRMSTLGKFIYSSTSAVRNYILPSLCLSCDTPIAETGHVCAKCWASIRHIEPPYCPIMGNPFSHDLGENVISAEAIANPPSFDTSRSVALYDDQARRLIQGLKFSSRTDLAPWLAAWMYRWANRNEPDMIADPAIIIPVPLHRTRLLSRRYNQSAELARHFARLASLRYQPELLVRSRATKQQVGLAAKQRHQNVSGAFQVPKAHKPTMRGSHIVLIDDVYTTGATLQACSRTLKRAGALRVDCLTFARVASGDI